MDENTLKELFLSEDIPAPDDNARKAALNLAVAEFEKTQEKSEKTSQGNGFLARLIGRTTNQRSDKMDFSKKKVVYGGLATACVALMVFGIAPEVLHKADDRAARVDAAAVTGQLAANSVASVDKVAEREERKVAKKEMVAAGADAGANMVMQDRAVMPSESVPTGAAISPQFAGKTDKFVASVPAPVMPAAPSPTMIMPHPYNIAVQAQQEFGRDKFENVAENPLHQVKTDPVSTFSIDVDTASYSFMRGSLTTGILPQKESVRIEELINYFDYDYPLPQNKEQPFSTNVVLKPSPWGANKKLMVIGIKGYEIPKATMPNSNLVFLIDTSGSMNDPQKLPLLKQSLSMLLEVLKPTDTISIVTYAGSAGTVLPPTKVANQAAILAAIQNLNPGGGTAGAEGIRQAYALAEQSFDKEAVNRVILGTDGDFNVGITSPEDLKNFVSREKDKGIFLSVLGFGRGNYNDEMMQKLAQNGNGVAAYIDNLNEAKKVLVEEATKTLFPIAKDVKIQVEFNPDSVAEYRLVGYETRALKTEDFNNDKVDAGDIGAGAQVTAIYEVTPIGAPTAVDDSRYAKQDVAKARIKVDVAKNNELAFVKIRYKLPNANESKLIETPVAKIAATPVSPQLESETSWAVAVASFGQMLKGGIYTGKMTYDDVLRLATEAKGADRYGYRAEFIGLVERAKHAAALEPQPNWQGGPVPQPVPQPIRPDTNYPYPVPQTR